MEQKYDSASFVARGSPKLFIVQFYPGKMWVSFVFLVVFVKLLFVVFGSGLCLHLKNLLQALDGFDLSTLHKLISREKLAEPRFEPVTAG